MYVIGVTGGIGSGKSAVTDRFAERGIVVVDADLAARVVVEPGKPALAAIADQFGENLIQSDGQLDRAALRKLVFAEEKNRLWLEQLTHPLIGEEIAQQLQHSKSPYTVFVSPLLIETPQQDLADRILVVDVPVEIQIERTMARDSNDEAQVKAIIASQATREQRLEKADDVICNDRGFEWLDEEVTRLHQVYLKLAESAAK